MSRHAVVLNVDTGRYPQLATRFKVQGIPRACFKNLIFEGVRLQLHRSGQLWVTSR